MEQPERRLLIAVDMERYSRRTNLQQYEAQRAFQLVLHEAATAVGLDRISWRTQQAGDGELAILPTDAREPRVIGRLVPELDRLLRRYNGYGCVWRCTRGWSIWTAPTDSREARRSRSAGSATPTN